MLEQIKIGGNTMNAKKQLLTSVLCASLILASFAGCSGKENPGSAPDSSAGVSVSSDMGTASQGGEENPDASGEATTTRRRIPTAARSRRPPPARTMSPAAKPPQSRAEARAIPWKGSISKVRPSSLAPAARICLTPRKAAASA